MSAETTVKEKHITFYLSYGYLQSDHWHIPFRLWVSEAPGRVRRLSARGGRKVLRKAIGIEKLSDVQEQRYLDRFNDFIADSKSRQQIQIHFDNDPRNEGVSLVAEEGQTKTDFNGLLQGVLLLSEARANELLQAQGSRHGWLQLKVVGGDYEGTGAVQLISPEGHSVISDIDDTIKVTNIPGGEKMVLHNVFFKEYEAAPCMSEMYREFGSESAFHYVSGSPWQLYAPLSEFLFSSNPGFPLGSMHMKNVRTNLAESASYKDFWKLAGFAGSATVAQKIAQINLLLSHFPKRTFTLIGDSGEHDPEIFAAVRQSHPDQVEEIRIRDVVDAETLEPDRLGGMTVIPAFRNDCEAPSQ